MKISIITLFPEFFESPLETSIVGRALESGLADVELIHLRQHGLGPHRQVDDEPFGGGPGMVLRIEPIAAAMELAGSSHRVLLSPSGVPLTQAHLTRWATYPHLTLVCGRYEGVDERVAEHLVDEEVSVGDYVLAGGEAAAVVVIEGVVRLLPGALGNPQSLSVESFEDGLLGEPQYTRPAEFRGWKVPEVLLSGDHAAIESWRNAQRRQRTRHRRPDLAED